MKTKLFILVTAGMLVFGLMTAFSHHAIVSTYDFNKEIKLDGKMVLMLFRNPHAFVHIDVPDEQGVQQRWSIEWGGASQLGGQGVTRNTFKPGDQVIITGNPSRTPGERRMKMNTLHRPKDGFAWGFKPGEVVN
jgi:hypothetical protein